MLDFIRTTRSKQLPCRLCKSKANDRSGMSASKHSSLRSSADDGPPKSPSTANPVQSRALSLSHPAPSHAYSHQTPRPVPKSSASLQSITPKHHQALDSISSYSHAPSSISKASASLVAAHGEFHGSSNAAGSNDNRGCIGQVDLGDGPRGPRNPHGLSLDKSRGYFPQGSEVLSGTASQVDMTQHYDRSSLDDLLRMIAAERLHQMPQKGSNWDRSIRALESFALKVSGYAGRYSSVVGNAQLTASMIYGRCYALLQQGRSQTTSLVPAIGVLAGLSYVLSLFTKHPPRPTSSQVHQYLNQILDRTLELVYAMTSYFQGLSVMLGPSTGRAGLGDALSQLVKGFDLQADQLLNEIWTLHVPPNTQDPIVQFNQIQRLLQPQDEVVRTAQKILLAERGSRQEFTCEWFAKPFLDFVRGSDNALWIDGRIGCGKSVLCGWILESLQGPVDGEEYAVITAVIDPLLPSETSTASVIKMLLQQLVRQQYGSHKSYSALANLVGTLTAGVTPVQVENELWECLQICVADTVQPTMLVIDGLGEIEGGEAAAAALFQKLLNSVAVSPLVRLLVLSRPFPFSSSTPLRRRTVEAKDVNKDIRRVITDLVPSHSPTPGAEIARRIDHDADGNFFWSLLTLQHWAAQDFSPQTWRNLPKSLDATIALLVSKIDLSDQVTCLVLFSSIIASRPLRLVEVETILRLDVKNNTLMPQAPDVTRAINQSSGSLLIVQDGLVLFRHALLRQALLESLQFETLSLSPEMHADMAIRSLLYLRLALTQDSELTLEPTKESTLETLFDAFPFLPYALRHWTEHFVASSMFTHPYTFNPTSDCRLVFPNTVNAAIIEASFWRQYLSHEAPRALTIAATMRTVIFGDHEATLQTTACLAETLRMTEDYKGAATNFAIASELGQQLLPRFHPFIATCMFKFLDVMNLADEKEDLLSQKASALRYLISMYETQSGPSSDQTLDFCYLLANHYDDMQQSSLSADMHQKIHQLVIDRYGKNSPQAKLSQEKLVTVLHGKSDEGGHSYSDSVFDDIVQTYAVTDARRIKASIAKAEEYISQGDPFNAELIYISLWHGIAEVCHSQKTHENHEKLLQTGLAYARFLRESDRLSDAQTVLLGLWSQQQALEYQSETTTSFLEEVAMEMERSGLPDVALVILETVLASSVPQSSDPESDRQSALRKAISDITLDMMQDPQRPPGEAALKLPYTDASVVNTLIGRLVSSGRLDDVIAVGALTLHRLRPSIMDDSSGQGHSALDELDPESAKLAANLAQAYMRTNQIEKAGLIYQNLFQSVRSSDTVEDSSHAVEYAELAITAFEQSGQIDRIITLREGLVHQHSRHGEHRSIESRYALASLYAKGQRLDDAKQQYTKIAEHLKQPYFLEFTLQRKTIIMKAALELANIKMAENSDDMECNRLYELLVDIQEEILPDEREYTGAIVEEAESRLTKIYEEGINRHFMNGETVSRAARLQGKKYQKQKTREGASQPATLSNLAVWISMLTKEGASDFRAVAVRELQLAIDSVIESDVQPSGLYNAAVVLATSFAANGFLDDGIDIVQRLTEQVIFQQDGIDQQARSNLVFLTAFEAHLTGSMVDFAEIHAKVLMESALWEHYKRLSQTGAESVTTLACGARLRSFLIEHASLDRAALIEDGLYQRFIDDYGAAFTNSLETARDFFRLLLEDLSSDRVQLDNFLSLVSAALNKRVGSLLGEGHYRSALDLSSPGFDFIRFVRSNDSSNLEHGLQLGLMLAGVDVAPAPDHAVAAQMQDLSKNILHETLRECRSQDFNFNVVDIELVSHLASVLGMQQNYEDLEWLLTRLWLSRRTLTSVSQDVIVQIGRRLVEVRFFHGHIDSAIELGEDLLYNLQRVYGTNHPSTVDISSFLSSLYIANGDDDAAALAVLGDSSSLKLPDTRAYPAKPNQPHGADTGKSNLDHLLHFYQGNKDTEKSSQSATVAKQLSEKLGHSSSAGDVVRNIQQPPKSWGFIDGGGDKSFDG